MCDSLRFFASVSWMYTRIFLMSLCICVSIFYTWNNCFQKEDLTHEPFFTGGLSRVSKLWHTSKHHPLAESKARGGGERSRLKKVRRWEKKKIHEIVWSRQQKKMRNARKWLHGWKSSRWGGNPRVHDCVKIWIMIRAQHYDMCHVDEI